MKISKGGTVVHRDDCAIAIRNNLKSWWWSEGMSDNELYLRLAGYSHMKLCQKCFRGTPLQLATAAALKLS